MSSKKMWDTLRAPAWECLSSGLLPGDTAAPKSEGQTIDGYTTRVIEGREVLFDDEGYLVNPEDWTRELAELLAYDIGIEKLTDPQWKIVGFVRDFYLQNGRAPLNRDLRKASGMSLMDIEGLFPEGIRRGARRIAGLPNPKTC